MNEKELRRKTEFLLDEIGMKINLKGYKYWIEAVKLKLLEPNISMSNLYEEIAKKFNINRANAERCLRKAWESNIKYVEMRLNYSYKITNSIMLEYLVRKLEE